MKILFFNLGTIEHRVLSWEVDGFKSLFEQDIILWGPVPDSQFVYNGKEIPILRIYEETTVEELFNKLPEGWYPDIVSCDTSAISYVPDIYKCPVKTVIFTRDSWSDTVFNRGLVEFFDFLNSSTVDRSVYQAFHVNMLPLRGFAVSTPGPGTYNSEFDNRDIDVVAIANYDSSFYHERHKMFYTLSSSGTNYDIRFLRSIKRSEIYNYYQRSKIVFDWAHTLSNRSYEAALNGCLLFSHEDNRVLSDFWVPWEEYIPYNENNLSELISRYLKNPEMSKKVAERAREKISKVPATWGEMAWERICAAYESEASIPERIEYNQSLSPSLVHYRTATPLLYNYDYGKNFPGNWQEVYFERIGKAISAAKTEDEKLLPLIEAARMEFLLRKDRASFSFLDQLEETLPEYAWVYYMKARLLLERKEHDTALKLLNRSLESARKAPELLQKYVLPVIEKGNSCDGRRITNYMWQAVYKDNNEYQVNALYHLAYELKGYVYELRGERHRAIEAYSSAINSIPVPDCIHRLSHLLIEANDYIKLSSVAVRGHEDSPYDTLLVLFKVYAWLWTGQKLNAVNVLRIHKRALHSFKGIRQINLIRMVFTGMIPLIFISVRLSSFLIIKLAERIKRKSGFSYLR
jgi:tetratricopeptide (TPR) repeat protein